MNDNSANSNNYCDNDQLCDLCFGVARRRLVQEVFVPPQETASDSSILAYFCNRVHA